jgi:hypothetical protein
MGHWCPFFIFFFEAGSCYVAQAVLELRSLSIPLPAHPPYWDYRHAPPHPAPEVLYCVLCFYWLICLQTKELHLFILYIYIILLICFFFCFFKGVSM